ncbi:5'-Nucleotidase domain protein [hydrothermal vent metagenome]|uniref:5'-Nucleotidase domain protein n=1 Tax=hydrothermal vent metagenome TaxID=652676 RepID=A0A3B1CZF0_9ZZZZ
MKNLLNIIFFICVFVFPNVLNAQNLTNQEMLEFYPYNLGNSWSYLWVYHNVQNDYYEAGRDNIVISSDTTINDVKYWLVQDDYKGYGYYEYYIERIDSVTGDVLRLDAESMGEINRVDNIYASVGDTVSISNNRFLLYCDKIVVLSIRDTVINNFETSIREVVGLPTLINLFFARNIGFLGSGQNFWIDTAKVNGIIFSDISSDLTDVKDDNVLIGTDFVLYQNYPNPFNPSTTIKYTLPRHGGQANVERDLSRFNGSELKSALQVTLKIYDILGREVATLVNKGQKPGNYEVQWNAGDNPSGIYFYRLQSGNFTDTKKLILLR